jgi:dTDP-4-dehydrorhamnose reductase
MRFLVTGAGGQLATALTESALAVEWLFAGRGELDVTSSRAIEACFERFGPDVVVNCAAYNNVDVAEREHGEALQVNSEAPRFLAEAALRCGAVLIHISTDYVFGGTARRPYTEVDAPSPVNFYGQSKLAGERGVLESGCRGAVIRTSWLYSPWRSNFVKSIVAAARKNAEIRVVDDQTSSPTSAITLAGAIEEMIPSLVARADKPAELYHFADAGAVSRVDFAAEIIRRAGLSCRVVPVSSEEWGSVARRPAYSALDTAKITRDFGIVARPWEQELAECMERICAQP